MKKRIGAKKEFWPQLRAFMKGVKVKSGGGSAMIQGREIASESMSERIYDVDSV
jgi:hypothetical protein